MRSRSTRTTAPLLLLLAAAIATPASAAAQVPAGPSLRAEYDGAAATGLALRRLGTTARVLHIAAHPDDENTALFSPLALGRGIDAAYLSLTRGEGGQNGIGPELGVGLGVIRSEELLAARRLDGARQFFSRAIDYGYSKNADEAFRHWPRDTLLSDVVEVIRRYRPDVVVSVWSGTPRDGHGQHEASGVVARAAVLAAGDPTRFPEQLEAGLRPHTPALYYRSAWFSEGPPDVALNTGELDPLLGASYHQIAMASRSRHRSQDQGRRLDPGPRSTGFDRVDPAAPVEVAETRSFGRYGPGAADATPSLFEGVDTLLSQRAARVARLSPVSGDSDHRRVLDRAVQLLREYERLVHEARADFSPFEPWAVVPTLAGAQDRLETVAAALGGGMTDRPATRDAIHDLHFHLRAELDDLRGALLQAANVTVDVTADEALVVPGQTFRLELSVWNGGIAPVRAQAGPLLPDGWIATPVRDDAGEEGAGDGATVGRSGDGELLVPPGDRATASYEVTVPADAAYTMPYYLDPEASPPVDLYDWPEDPDIRALPFAPPPVRGSFLLALAGVAHPLPLERDAARIGVDARDGEYRQPVKVVPALSVALEPAVAVVPLTDPDRPHTFTVRLRSETPDTVTGELRPVFPGGWRVEPARTGVVLSPGSDRTLSFRVAPPADVAPGEYRVAAELRTDDGARYTLGYDVVDYPHIRPHHLYEPARARVRALDVEVADVRVGYVRGTGGGVAEAMDQLGVDWSPLSEQDLAEGDLDRFDVIITGIRAYEVRDDLVAHNQRLLDWVRRGGTLIVQYNRYGALRRDYAPWPVTISRPHGRVTDPAAPVTVLEPDHPALTTPNRIGPADWEDWVQERGLYFWESWADAPLTPLLAMSDPGEAPLTGSLLVGPLGQGTYVYTGLAFFRQLPEAVPGAYRLLANLISLGARP